MEEYEKDSGKRVSATGFDAALNVCNTILYPLLSVINPGLNKTMSYNVMYVLTSSAWRTNLIHIRWSAIEQQTDWFLCLEDK